MVAGHPAHSMEAWAQRAAGKRIRSLGPSVWGGVGGSATWVGLQLDLGRAVFVHFLFPFNSAISLKNVFTDFTVTLNDMGTF